VIDLQEPIFRQKESGQSAIRDSSATGIQTNKIIALERDEIQQKTGCLRTLRPRAIWCFDAEAPEGVDSPVTGIAPERPEDRSFSEMVMKPHISLFKSYLPRKGDKTG